MAYDKKTGREFDPSDPDQVAWNNSANYGGDPRGPGGIQYPGEGWQDRHPDHRSSGGGRDHHSTGSDNFQRQLEYADRHRAKVNAALTTLEDEGLVTRIHDSIIFGAHLSDGYVCAEKGKRMVILGNHANRLAPIIEQYKDFFKCEFDHEALAMLMADVMSIAHDQALSFDTMLSCARAKFKERQDHAPDRIPEDEEGS